MKNINKLLTAMLIVCIVVAALATMSSCDAFFEGTVDPGEHQHTLTEVPEVAATCDKAGAKAHYVCSGCDKLFADAEGENEITAPEAIEPKGHTEVIDAAVEATCSVAGKSEGKHCSVCNTVTVEQEIIAPLGHKWNEGEVTLEPTCTSKGSKTFTCERGCKKAEDIEINPDAHSWGEGVVDVPATCSAKGTTKYTCQHNAEHTKTEEIEINADAHSWEESAKTPATCTDEGSVKYTCKHNSAHTYSDVIPAKGHSYSSTLVVEGAVTHYEPGAIFNTDKLVVKLGCTACDLFETVTGYTVSKTEALQPTDSEIVISYVKDGITYTATVAIDVSHSHVMVYNAAVKATCEADGNVEYYYCSICQNYYADENGNTPIAKDKVVIEKLGHSWSTEVIEQPTCTENGTVKYICSNDASHNYTDELKALGHDWSENIYEGEDGFYVSCTNNCGATNAVDAPVADSYNAVLDNSFASNKDNILNLVYGNYGAWGVTTSGTHKVEIADGSPASGAIGGLDKAGGYVYYEFVMDKPGTVDLIWNIAGSNWDSSVGGNKGIADMAQHMTVTIDGKPVNVSGIALPIDDIHPWWNLQNVVIKDVVLDAGVHTFKCDITAAGGLNVGSMTVKSTKEVNARSANVTSAKVSVEGDKVYYVLTADIYGYNAEDIKFWHNSTTSYDITSYETTGNVATIKFDVTDLAVGVRVDPHMSFDGRKYVNGANLNGDVRGLDFIYDEMVLVANGKSYVIHEYYSMPSLYVKAENYVNIRNADIYEEDGKAYYVLTYLISGYDPASFEFFDKTTVYEVESIVNNNNGLVTFKFNLTDKNVGYELWPHLRVNGEMWDGASNTTSSNGDVKISVTTKLVTIGEKTYIIRNQYDIPTITVVDKTYMKIQGADIYKENNRVYYTLTYLVSNYDLDSFEFFDNNTFSVANKNLTYENKNGVVTFKMDVTDMAAADTFWPHLKVNGKNWDGASNIADAKGDVKVNATTETITLGDKTYTLKVQYSMPTVVVVAAE